MRVVAVGCCTCCLFCHCRYHKQWP